MDALRIVLDEDGRRFLPGERISGRASWELEKAPKKAEIRLIWLTQGIGTRDVGIVETAPLEQPRAEDEQKFSFRLPAGPYTFSGKLVSLQWAVELAISPGGKSEQVRFDLSPFDDPIILEKLPDLPKKGVSVRVGS